MAVASPAGSTISVGRKARLKLNNKTICFAKVRSKTTREIVANFDGTICADLDMPIQRIQKGRHLVGWEIEIDFTWPILDVLLPLLGISALGSDVYALGRADEVVAFPIQINMVGAIHDIDAAYVTKWALRG